MVSEDSISVSLSLGLWCRVCSETQQDGLIRMKEGFWINYRTGREFPIHEHELCVRVRENAHAIETSPSYFF